MQRTHRTQRKQNGCVKFDAMHATQAPKNQPTQEIRTYSIFSQATQASTNQDTVLVKFPNSKNKPCLLLSLFYQFQSYNNVYEYRPLILIRSG